ncbi:hypothetical protein [Streptomyces sp. NPDC058758]|uniref:hypothetical protein n=1 Tax=Streptomyces sp. NPDC058758 TaxID=3346627 RepID=UPI00368A2E8F
MRFLITNDELRPLAVVDVSDAEETVTLAVERADRPELGYIALDLRADGSLTVGHWPTGEDWEELHSTEGVPLGDSFEVIPALPPEQYPLDAITRALETARDRAKAFTADPAPIDVFYGAALALLRNPASQYPNPDSEAGS